MKTCSESGLFTAVDYTSCGKWPVRVAGVAGGVAFR